MASIMVGDRGRGQLDENRALMDNRECAQASSGFLIFFRMPTVPVLDPMGGIVEVVRD
jgi:hypothetical protein